ncbi:MAG: Hsp70 family protein, partial [Pirellula sp.]
DFSRMIGYDSIQIIPIYLCAVRFFHMTIIGIDLGTTNSLCAVFQAERTVLIPSAHGRSLTPSVVARLEDGQILVGDAAQELRVTKPQLCASRFKRLMGTQETIQLGNQSFSAPELSSFVLRSLKSDAEKFLSKPVSKAVITVPAYFNDLQRRATRFAGELAGLEVVRVINEPTAAALTYGFYDRDLRKKLMVIDLGGGTFDVTIMQVFERMLEIIASAGESMLGGEDFTDRIASNILMKYGLQPEIVEHKHPLQLARLKQKCEEAKLKLLVNESVEISLPSQIGDVDPTQQPVNVHRDEFEKWMEPLLARLMRPIERALGDANLDVSQLDEVLLVGGATRMNCLQNFLTSRLKRKPLCEYNPDEVVAMGAAIQAALIEDNVAVEDMVLTDVCPHTLGIEVCKHFGGEFIPGYFEPIIHRNTTIPVSKEKRFSTVAANQTEVQLRVYQGEGRRAEDNLLLGELKIDGIPLGKAGAAFDVRFSYDPSGILEVEVIIPQSGKTHRAVISHPDSRMNPKQVQEIVRKLQKVKFYPRDLLENKYLLSYCERILGELPIHLREELDELLDVFENGLRSGDPSYYEQTRNQWQIWLSSHGFSFDEGADG